MKKKDKEMGLQEENYKEYRDDFYAVIDKLGMTKENSYRLLSLLITKDKNSRNQKHTNDTEQNISETTIKTQFTKNKSTNQQIIHVHHQRPHWQYAFSGNTAGYSTIRGKRFRQTRRPEPRRQRKRPRGLRHDKRRPGPGRNKTRYAACRSHQRQHRYCAGHDRPAVQSRHYASHAG